MGAFVIKNKPRLKAEGVDCRTERTPGEVLVSLVLFVLLTN